MCCHDLEVMSLNTGQAELGVHSTSVKVALDNKTNLFEVTSLYIGMHTAHTVL